MERHSPGGSRDPGPNEIATTTPASQVGFSSPVRMNTTSSEMSGPSPQVTSPLVSGKGVGLEILEDSRTGYVEPSSTDQLEESVTWTELGVYFARQFLAQLQAVVPVSLYFTVFLALVFRQFLTNVLSILFGLSLVIVGLVFFLEGLKIFFMPLSERIGWKLPLKFALPPVLGVVTVLGVLCTYAEPAINALVPLGELVAPYESPYLYWIMNPWRHWLVLSIGAGVGLSILLGTLRLTLNWKLNPMLYITLIIAIGPAIYLQWGNPHLRKLVPLAWDIGVVATGPVTVPITLALGSGIAQASPALAKNPLSGFGLVALASLYPIITVQALMLLLSFLKSRDDLLIEIEILLNKDATTTTSIWDISPYQELILSLRAILPLAGLLLVILILAVREEIPALSWYQVLKADREAREQAEKKAEAPGGVVDLEVGVTPPVPGPTKSNTRNPTKANADGDGEDDDAEEEGVDQDADELGLEIEEDQDSYSVDDDDAVRPSTPKSTGLTSEAHDTSHTNSHGEQEHLESHVKDTVVQVLHQDTTDDSEDFATSSKQELKDSTSSLAPRNKRTGSTKLSSSGHLPRLTDSMAEIPRVELKHKPSTIVLSSSQNLQKKPPQTPEHGSESEADDHFNQETDSYSERESSPVRRRGALTDDEEEGGMTRDEHHEPGFFDSMRISIDGTRLHLQRQFPPNGYDTEFATDSEIDTEMETDIETDLDTSRGPDDIGHHHHHHRHVADEKEDEMKLSRRLRRLQVKSMSVMKRHGAFLFGLAFVQIGCLLFNWGIVYGLSPLSLQVGGWLPTAYMHVNGVGSSPKFQYAVGVLFVLVFGFLLGALVTLAEPGMAVFCRQVSSLTNGEVDTTFLLTTVSVGVGAGLGIGLLTLVFHVPTLYIVLGGYPIAVLFTIFTPNVGLSAVAWDAAGTVTGPVTTPLVLSIGLAFGLKDPLVDGFGVLTCAAIFPIVSILATKMTMDIFTGLKAQARASPFKPGQMGVLSATLLWEDGEIDLDGKKRYHHHKRRRRRHRRRRKEHEEAASSDEEHRHPYGNHNRLDVDRGT